MCKTPEFHQSAQKLQAKDCGRLPEHAIWFEVLEDVANTLPHFFFEGTTAFIRGKCSITAQLFKVGGFRKIFMQRKILHTYQSV